MPTPNSTGIRLRPDQIDTVKKLYPEISISVIARVLFDLFLNSPYEEEVQDAIYEESARTNIAMSIHQFKKKENPEDDTARELTPSLKLREQLLRSLRDFGV